MSRSSTTLSIPSGAYVDISVPPNASNGQGQFPKDAATTVKINGQEREHVFGYVSEFLTVGTITPVLDQEDIVVRYTHLQGKANRIFYFTASDDRHDITIVSMPMHDHSSVQQGGPAYGTYVADIPPVPETP